MGHVGRAIALAEAWIRAGGSAVLAVNAEVADRASALAPELAIVAVDAPVGSDADAAQLADLARRADWVVVDGYPFGPAFARTAGIPEGRTLLVDDHGRGPGSAAAVVLDQNPGVEADTYADRPSGSTLLRGPRCSLLRSRDLPPARVDQRPERLLVALGGDPTTVTTDLVADALRAVEDLALTVDVIGGGDLSGLAGLPRVRVHGFVADPGPLFAGADVALVAAGTTSWELCRQGVPTVALATAENQIPVTRALDEAGAALVPTDEPIADLLRRLVTDPVLRAALASNGRRLVDGRGAARVVAALRSRDVALRPADAADGDLLLAWANDPLTRASSFDRRPIEADGHRAWLAARLADAGSDLWIAQDDRGPWGLVRFESGGGRAEIGVSIAPDRRGAGLAAPLIRAGVRRLFADRPAVTVVDARIRPENRASVAAFDLAGFTRTDDVDPLRFEAERTDGW